MEFDPLQYSDFLTFEQAKTVIFTTIITAIGALVLWGYYKHGTYDRSTSTGTKFKVGAITSTVVAIVGLIVIIAAVVSVEKAWDKIDAGFDANMELKYATEKFDYKFPTELPNQNRDGEIFDITIIMDGLVVEAKASFDPETGEPFLYDYIEGEPSEKTHDFSVKTLERNG